jgi:hypothetical protein
MAANHEPVELLLIEAEGFRHIKEPEFLVGDAGMEHFCREPDIIPCGFTETIVKINVDIHGDFLFFDLV